jgi:hypothetical protein
MRILRVVADSSCLIGLAQIGLFGLLKDLFLEVHIPPAVYQEVVVNGRDETGANETESALKEGWILLTAAKDEIAVKALTTALGKGESEVIVLSKELDADFALMDEKSARNTADLLNVDTVGILGIIDLANEMGFSLDKKRLVDCLRQSGFRISEKIYKKLFPE